MYRCHPVEVVNSLETKWRDGRQRREAQTLPFAIHDLTSLYKELSASLLLFLPARLASIKRLGVFQTGLIRLEQRKALVVTAQRPITTSFEKLLFLGIGELRLFLEATLLDALLNVTFKTGLRLDLAVLKRGCCECNAGDQKCLAQANRPMRPIRLAIG